ELVPVLAAARPAGRGGDPAARRQPVPSAGGAGAARGRPCPLPGADGGAGPRARGRPAGRDGAQGRRARGAAPAAGGAGRGGHALRPWGEACLVGHGRRRAAAGARPLLAERAAGHALGTLCAAPADRGTGRGDAGAAAQPPRHPQPGQPAGPGRLPAARQCRAQPRRARPGGGGLQAGARGEIRPGADEPARPDPDRGRQAGRGPAHPRRRPAAGAAACRAALPLRPGRGEGRAPGAGPRALAGAGGRGAARGAVADHGRAADAGAAL
ncbi:MAG: hypothetical protein AVDCRST_MAG27-207, partial [uncultured Craurococcus sp.]